MGHARPEQGELVGEMPIHGAALHTRTVGDRAYGREGRAHRRVEVEAAAAILRFVSSIRSALRFKR